MSHAYQDAVSLEMARRVVQRLRADPSLIEVAHANLRRWSQRNADSPSLLRCYREWQEILRRPLDEVCDILLDRSDEGQRLRQNSPVHGVDPDTAVLLTGWEKRLRRVATGTWPSWRHSCGIEWRMPSCCARGWRKRRSTNASDESVSHVSARLRAGRCVTAWTAPR